jgi:hypothetical protein
VRKAIGAGGVKELQYVLILIAASIFGPLLGLFGFKGALSILESPYMVLVYAFWSVPVALVIVVLDIICKLILKDPSIILYSIFFMFLSLVSSIFANYVLGSKTILFGGPASSVALYTSILWCLGWLGIKYFITS